MTSGNGMVSRRLFSVSFILLMFGTSFGGAFAETAPAATGAEPQGYGTSAMQAPSETAAPEIAAGALTILLQAAGTGTAGAGAPGTGTPGATGAGTAAGSPGTGLTGAPSIGAAVKRAEFECRTPGSNPEEKVLHPQEVQKLKRLTEVDSNGFGINEISSGIGSKPNRKELENNLIVQQPDKNNPAALLNQVPGTKIDAGELMHYYNRFTPGPFAFGVSLYDSLRVGRCASLSPAEMEALGCPVEDKGLLYRNSGEGIVSDFKTVWNDVKDIFSGEKQGQFTKEEAEKLQVNLGTQAEDDLNSLKVKIAKRTENMILNSVKTADFTADMGTNCNNNSCLISSYSLFDKYYNSWFSAEMVISNFGPTLFGQAKKYLGWARRRGWPWDMSENKFANWFRRQYMGPDTLIGEGRAKNIITQVDKYGFGPEWAKMTENADWDSGYLMIKGGSARKMVGDWGKPGGFFDSITDPVRKGEFFKISRELNSVAKTNKAIFNQALESYQKTVSRFGAGSVEAVAAKIEYARTNARMMKWMDDMFSLDAPEWWVRDQFAGLYDVGVKPMSSQVVQPLTGDSKHIHKILEKYVNDGGFAGGEYETTADGLLKLYKISPKGEFIGETAVEDLQKNFSRFVDKAVITERGEVIQINSTTLDYIVKETPGHGTVKVYKANWEAVDPETPERFAGRLTHARVSGRLGSSFPDNTQRIYDALVERNFAGKSRRYYSLLDKAMAQEDEILKSYFSVKGGLKWTIMPYLYWEGKRGFGFEGMSAYQLPDTWNSVEMYTGDHPIFSNSFIDFFANEGSDEGDIFGQVLEKLPWKMVFNYVWDNYLPAKNAYDQFAKPGSGWRRSVENVAYFTSTQAECATCSVLLQPKSQSPEDLARMQKTGEGEGVIAFNTKQDMQSYMVEDTITDKAKEGGTTLISFGYHTNLKGSSPGGEQGIEGGQIDLPKAIEEKKTCKDAVKRIGLGFVGDNPQRAAAILAFGESAGYALFFWSGIMGSVIQQTLIAPELQDCVDDVGGYYVHMFSPPAEGKAGAKNDAGQTANQNASKKVGDAVQSFTDTLTGKAPAKQAVEAPKANQTAEERTLAESQDKVKEHFAVAPETKESQKGLWERFKDQFAEKAQELSDKAKASTILQIDLKTVGQSYGIFFFRQLFFYWFKGNTMPAVYDDVTKTVLKDNDSNIAVVIDRPKGEIGISKNNGPVEPVITSKDQSRMSGPDGRIPAITIPQRIGEIGLPTEGNAVPMFEMDIHNQIAVLEPTVLECIKRNIEEQTGVPLNGNKITDAFGSVEAIITDVYASVTADEKAQSITANGVPRETVMGANAKVLIMSDRNSTMHNGREVSLGKFNSIQFKNGVILYKPETNELLIWIRYNDKSILRPGDAKGMKATPATVQNAETGCEEQAINLEAIPNTEAGDNSSITERVTNFNKSIQKMGPFQIFDTDTHRFMFYSQKTSPTCSPTEPGCCQDRVRIINKKTGEVYDQALAGPIEQTPTGVKFKTADGQEHTLDFGVDGSGAPTVSYNGGPPEVLRTARGPNGSFWYDPDTGLWYPENSQLLPLAEGFKQQGFDTQHRANCETTTLPGGNSLNVQLGGAGSGSPFNLPSMPENPLALLLFIVSMLAAMVVGRAAIEKRLAEK